MVPELNSNIVDLNNTDDVKYQQLQTVDISIAVATDKGLITPIVKNADRISVEEISRQVKLLADKAKANKLQPHEFQGGSFSISNLGMFGIKEFSAVINPPQVGILAIGKSDLVINHENNKETQTIVKLSFDERCVDLQSSYRFLDYFKYFIENPQVLVGQRQTIDSL
jgi:pyruvate dehydrogenase E2 component (dihydrolipoamide acetyltransferase)